jgi:hypothetical protein
MNNLIERKEKIENTKLKYRQTNFSQVSSWLGKKFFDESALDCYKVKFLYNINAKRL